MNSPAVEEKRARTSACMSAFRAAQEPLRRTWSQFHAVVPRRLYHYTTLESFMGITSSASIWASDVRFLNDASELTYAATLIDDVIRNVFLEVQDEHLRRRLPPRVGVANLYEIGLRPFVACFCDDDDLLSQWRAYGRDDPPVAMGFEFRRVLEPSLGADLRRVIYDEMEQRQLVTDVTKTWVQTAQTLLDSYVVDCDELFPYPAIWALQQALAEHHVTFKHPAFREEREWRLITIVSVSDELRRLDYTRTEADLRRTSEEARARGWQLPNPQLHPLPDLPGEGIDIKCRPSVIGSIPYIDLPLSWGGRLPVFDVVQGPTAYPELALESLNLFLRKHGHADIARLSRIPLRSQL